MSDQPMGRKTIMHRDRTAEEAGREHTGGLGERDGAQSTGGTATEPEAPIETDEADRVESDGPRP